MILMKRILSAAFASSIALTLGACSSGDSSQPDQSDNGITVATSFYPLAWLIEQVGGDDINVMSMTPSNVEPHDYELSPADIAKMNEADVVIYVEGFQPSMDEAVESLTGPKVTELSGTVDLMPLAEETEDDHDHDSDGHDHDHDHDHGTLDPHFWLDPVRMQDASGAVEDALASADSDNEQSYQENQKDVASALQDLDGRYSSGLKTCERDTIVTTHAAFGYLTDRYDLAQLAISGIDPEAEPSPADLASIKKTIGETDTTTVFAEELASPKTAQAVAEETGADLEVLSTLESQPEDGDYVDAMDDNLASIQGALGCN